MGNKLSCICSTPKPKVKILDLEGNLRHMEIPIKVAELMLETPGKFVSPADELWRTRRIPAMKADEELKGGKLYLLFPAERINYRASDEEMGLVAAVGLRKAKISASGSGTKVFPATVAEEKKEGIEGIRVVSKMKILRVEEEECDTGFPGHRWNKYRQWRPALETITETKLG